MGKRVEELAEKGILLYGSRRDEYAKEVPILLRGDLPLNWEWVDSSSNSIVAKRLQPHPAYYKEFLSRSSFEKIKALLRGSRCQRAMERGELLRQRGFHSPATHCWGKKADRYFMVTEGLNALNLSTYMEKNWIPPLSGIELRAKREIIEKLGKEVGNLHKAGICHGDLRISNVLLEETGKNIIFHFIDNERNAFFNKIPRRLITKNLVQLNMIRSPHVTLQDRLRFFHAYCEAYGGLNPAEKSALIQRVQRRTAERLVKKAEKESRAGQTISMIEMPRVATRKILSGPFRGMVVVDSALDQFLQSGGDPDALFQQSGSPLKTARSTRSALVELSNLALEGGREKLYVKEFRFKGSIHALKPLIRQHRAQVMWKVSLHLLSHSIPIPEPEGYLLKQKGPVCLGGYYYSKAIPECPSLSELAKDVGQLNQRLREGGLSLALAQNLATMHSSGAIHGDLKWSNILIHEVKNEVWFVDFDAAKLHRRSPDGKLVARDLARFVLSGLEAGVDGTLLARFLGHYAQHRNLTLKDIGGPMMKVLHKLRKRHEKNLYSKL